MVEIHLAPTVQIIAYSSQRGANSYEFYNNYTITYISNFCEFHHDVFNIYMFWGKE